MKFVLRISFAAIGILMITIVVDWALLKNET